MSRTWLLLALSLWGSTLAAQQLPLPDFRDSLGLTQSVAEVDALAGRYADKAQPGTALYLGVAAVRRGELSGRRGDLEDGLATLYGATQATPRDPTPWVLLGVAKLALHNGGYVPKQGPDQPMGRDWLQGAATAFMKALDRQPSHGEAAQLLTSTVLRQVIGPMAPDAYPYVARAAGLDGSAETQLALALVAREVDSLDVALAALDRYQQAGGDPSLANIERARTLYLAGRDTEAEEAWYRGLGHASPTALAHYLVDWKWLADSADLAEWAAQPDGAARVRFMRGFWDGRDVEAGREFGERLREHYRRLDYVRTHFQTTLEDRQRHSGLQSADPTSGLLALTVPQVVDYDGARDASPDARSIGRTASQIRVDASLSEVFARLSDQSMLRAYRSDQALLDDRGVVYLRQGEPTARASYHGAGASPNETWQYRTATGVRYFHFVGPAAPTRLVEQLPLHAGLFSTRSELDPRFERMASELRQITSNSRITVKPEVLEADRDANRADIAVGTTTDAFPIPFAHPTRSVLQAFGLRARQPTQGLLLASWAVEATSLPAPQPVDRGLVYPVEVGVVALERTTGAEVRVDSTRNLLSPRRLDDGEWLEGTTSLLVPPGDWQVSVVVRGADGESGMVRAVPPRHVPAPTAGVDMSDIVLGRVGAAAWTRHGLTVALNALNAFPREAGVSVYYQVVGAAAGTEFEVQIAVRPLDRPQARGTTVRFSDKAQGPLTEVTQSVDISALEPGAYLLEVTLSAPGLAQPITRSASLNVVR